MKRLEPVQHQGHGVDQIYGILACNPLAASASSYQKRSSCMLRHRLRQATSTQWPPVPMTSYSTTQFALSTTTVAFSVPLPK
ncbi:MAG: hypothetical protein J0H59_02245 [Comamonadaceae bacterium]|nr:hypothetical protein [Comamonadaceae bacterium]